MSDFMSTETLIPVHVVTEGKAELQYWTSEQLDKAVPRKEHSSKKWRDSVLSFYDRDATFIYDDTEILRITGYANKVEHRTFEPCILGKFVSFKNGVLEYKTDNGVFHIKCKSRHDMRRMITRSVRCKETGFSTTFTKMFKESVKRHGYIDGKPVSYEVVPSEDRPDEVDDA